MKKKTLKSFKLDKCVKVLTKKQTGKVHGGVGSNGINNIYYPQEYIGSSDIINLE